MKRIFLFLLSIIGLFVSANAQIGYQVTVYDQAKKEPKANQTVTATVTITDNAGNQIVSQSYTGETDDFGILSMTVGNANSFDKAKWNNLPFWISATVDGITISKTQIVNVPVAEYAKRTGTLTTDILCSKTWTSVYASARETRTYSFSKNGSGYYSYFYYGDSFTDSDSHSFTYYIKGDIVGCSSSDGWGAVGVYDPNSNRIVFGHGYAYH